MKALIDLFSTDYGLMSVGVILFVIIMAVYFLRLFMNKINGM
jgi:heme/copper-type cytochrome/quinol oxidase subunit 2